MERRFVIREIPNYAYKSGQMLEDEITESELIRRWDQAHIAMYNSDTPWQTALNILLHGEKEQEVKKIRGKYKDVLTPTDKPAYDPWDEWVEKMPMFRNEANGQAIWEHELKAWLRDCPCRKNSPLS